MTDLFREIDEELRGEQIVALLKKYQMPLIVGVVGLLVVVGGYTGWNAYVDSRQKEQSTQFYVATRHLEEGRIDKAIEAFDSLVANVDGGYAWLATYMEANAQRRAGKLDDAIATLTSMADGGDAPDNLQQLAALSLAATLLDAGRTEEAAARLGEITDDKDNLWRPLALELEGAVLLEKGDSAAAQEKFAAIVTDPASPPALRSRTLQMLALMGANTDSLADPEGE